MESIACCLIWKVWHSFVLKKKKKKAGCDFLFSSLIVFWCTCKMLCGGKPFFSSETETSQKLTEGSKYGTVLEENLSEDCRGLELDVEVHCNPNSNPEPATRATIEWLRSNCIYMLQRHLNPQLNPVDDVWPNLEADVRTCSNTPPIQSQ